MKIKELREKSDLELDKSLVDLQSRLQDCRFAIAGRRFKRVREMLDIRKTIARILTLKKERQTAGQQIDISAKQVAAKTEQPAAVSPETTN
jgi:large subunit ribosomal protein L29